jgi:hypothetical protein
MIKYLGTINFYSRIKTVLPEKLSDNQLSYVEVAAIMSIRRTAKSYETEVVIK